jgi:hypothetical protein
MKIKSHIRTKDFGEKIGKQQTKVRSEKTKIRARAVNELNNIDVVYMLGSEPFYVHSSSAYFQAGYKIALAHVDNALKNLWASRRSKMQAYANQIDSRWKQGFQQMFNDKNMTFVEFQKIWNNAISGGENPSKAFAILSQIAQLKDRKTKLAHYEIKQKDFRDRIKQATKIKDKTEANTKIQKIVEEASKQGIEIVITGKGSISWQGPASEKASQWRQDIKQSNSSLISMMESSNNSNYGSIIASNITAQRHAAAAKELGFATYEDFKKAALKGDIPWLKLTKTKNTEQEIELAVAKKYSNIDKMISISSKELGNMYEYATEELGSITIENTDLDIIGIGKKQSQSDSATTADTIFVAEGVFTIYASDKVSASVDYGSVDENKVEKTWPWYDLPINYQFHATLSTSLGTLSQLKVETQRAQEFLELEKLCNYVSANANAFYKAPGNIGENKYKEFKKLIMAYAAWLRISKAILGLPGDTIATDTPIALRTPTSIYNIADLLRFFINLENPVKITDFIQQSSYGSNFYKYSKPWAPIDRANLFLNKITAIEEIIEESSSDNDSNNAGSVLNYQAINARSVIHDFLDGVWGTNADFTTIDAHFVVKLKNLKNAF